MSATSAIDSNDLILVSRRDANGIGTPGAVAIDKVFDSVGVGYSSGGAVTQITSATTGVTLNSLCGQITTYAQSAAAAAEVQFTVTNDEVAVGDVVVVCIGTHTSAGTFIATVTAVAAGSFQITLTNLHASTAGNALLVLNFAVIKSAAS